MKKIILSAAVCFLAAGCADPYAQCKLGPARDVVGGSIDAMGGIGRWQSVKPITATAIVTIYDDAGKAMINEQHHVIDLREDVIRASARTAKGKWSIQIEVVKDCASVSSLDVATPYDPLLLVGSLVTTLHRVRGPMNLCGGDEKPIGSERVRIGGQDLIRVPVEGGNAGVKAYYFGAQTCALRLVTAGADEAGGEGTVTVYSWKMFPNGMAFPVRISVRKIGKNVLIGDTPVLEVDYRKVEW